MKNLKNSLFVLLFAGIALSATSCVITDMQPRHANKTTVKKTKSHPHGGPPGQTKKSKGHSGKKH